MNSGSPAIPPKVRDAVYIGGLIIGALVAVAAGVVGIWFPELKGQADATGVVLASGVAVIVGGLGTAYRPGANDGA